MRASGFFLLVAALGSAPAACRIEGGAPAAGADTIPGIETQVARMLERSAGAWNRGDLDGFMDDYLRSPTTTYIGSSGRVAGWEAIRARYAPLFQAGLRHRRSRRPFLSRPQRLPTAHQEQCHHQHCDHPHLASS